MTEFAKTTLSWLALLVELLTVLVFVVVVLLVVWPIIALISLLPPVKGIPPSRPAPPDCDWTLLDVLEDELLDFVAVEDPCCWIRVFNSAWVRLKFLMACT